MKKTIVVSLLILGVQGCSSGSPSTTDVEKAIKSGYLACSNLSVEHVKVINGLKIDDSTHQVQAQYDLRVIPLPDQEVQEVKEIIEEVETLRGQERQLDSPLQVAHQKREQFVLEHGSDAAAQDEGMQKVSSDIQEMNNEYDGLKQKEHDLISKFKYYKQLNTLTYNNPSLFDWVAIEWAAGSGGTPDSAGCLKKSGIDPTNRDAFVNALTKGDVSSYEVKFTMQKTDEGWMAVN